MVRRPVPFPQVFDLSHSLILGDNAPLDQRFKDCGSDNYSGPGFQADPTILGKAGQGLGFEVVQLDFKLHGLTCCLQTLYRGISKSTSGTLTGLALVLCGYLVVTFRSV